MKNNYIFVLSGNNKINGRKFLVIYDMLGKIIKKLELKTGKNNAIIEGNKWELEGLAFRNNELYTTVMTGYNRHNIKRLYRILKMEYNTNSNNKN
jgi:hypothetical protein